MGNQQFHKQLLQKTQGNQYTFKTCWTNRREISILVRNVDTMAPNGERLKSLFWSHTAVIGPKYRLN